MFSLERFEGHCGSFGKICVGFECLCTHTKTVAHSNLYPNLLHMLTLSLCTIVFGWSLT